MAEVAECRSAAAGQGNSADYRRWTVDMQQLFCPSSYSPSAPDKLGHFALSWSSGTQSGLFRCVDSTKLRNIQQLTGETRPGSVKRASILQN